jgi:hypothetical protein
MKKQIKGAALPAAFNYANLKRTADYFRKNWKNIPTWHMNLGKKVCRDVQPVAKAVAAEFGLTPLQARSVLMDAALCHILGLKRVGK